MPVDWSGRYLVDPWNGSGLVDLKRYPQLAEYLHANADRLRQRHIAQKRPAAWYRTIDRVDHRLTDRPKLVLPDMKASAPPRPRRRQLLSAPQPLLRDLRGMGPRSTRWALALDVANLFVGCRPRQDAWWVLPISSAVHPDRSGCRSQTRSPRTSRSILGRCLSDGETVLAATSAAAAICTASSVGRAWASPRPRSSIAVLAIGENRGRDRPGSDRATDKRLWLQPIRDCKPAATTCISRRRGTAPRAGIRLRPSSWQQCLAFDATIASTAGRQDMTDAEKLSAVGRHLQNGKGDFFNDLLALLLENCSGIETFHRRRNIVPGLTARNDNLDGVDRVTAPIQLLLQAKMMGMVDMSTAHGRRNRGDWWSWNIDKRAKELVSIGIHLKGEDSPLAVPPRGSAPASGGPGGGDRRPG